MKALTAGGGRAKPSGKPTLELYPVGPRQANPFIEPPASHVLLHKPEAPAKRHRWQNVFDPTDLPGGDLPLDLNRLAIRGFLKAGYERPATGCGANCSSCCTATGS